MVAVWSGASRLGSGAAWVWRGAFQLCVGAGVVAALALGPPAVEAQTRDDPAVGWSPEAAARYLDGRLSWWQEWPTADRDHDTSCVSCHTALPYALARPALSAALRQASPPDAESRLLDDVRKRVRLWSEVDPYYPDQTVGLPKTSESRGTEAILNTIVLANRDAFAGRMTNETRQAFDNLWKLQFTRGERSGGWAWLHFDLAPWESDGADYFGAALAAVAVGVAPDDYARSPEIRERLTLLRNHLLEDWEGRRPLDRLMLLWASSELEGLGTADLQRSIIDDLLRLQNVDGGWPLTSLGEWERQDGTTHDGSSDGYATGLIAYVLQRAGIPPREGDLARALSWLVRNQDPESGAWPASSLNRERDPASDRGRFMADAATAFAVLALTEAGVEGGL